MKLWQLPEGLLAVKLEEREIRWQLVYIIFLKLSIKRRYQWFKMIQYIDRTCSVIQSNDRSKYCLFLSMHCYNWGKSCFNGFLQIFKRFCHLIIDDIYVLLLLEVYKKQNCIKLVTGVRWRTLEQLNILSALLCYFFLKACKCSQSWLFILLRTNPSQRQSDNCIKLKNSWKGDDWVHFTEWFKLANCRSEIKEFNRKIFGKFKK